MYFKTWWEKEFVVPSKNMSMDLNDYDVEYVANLAWHGREKEIRRLKNELEEERTFIDSILKMDNSPRNFSILQEAIRKRKS